MGSGVLFTVVAARRKISLFEPYVRGVQARGKGLGLGLATVSRIVCAHGGRVGVRSSSAGCEFWFKLPASGSDPPQGRGVGSATKLTVAEAPSADRNGAKGAHRPS
jgi:hypothetical protein